jgi:hypothetical protein
MTARVVIFGRFLPLCIVRLVHAANDGPGRRWACNDNSGWVA